MCFHIIAHAIILKPHIHIIIRSWAFSFKKYILPYIATFGGGNTAPFFMEGIFTMQKVNIREFIATFILFGLPIIIIGLEILK